MKLLWQDSTANSSGHFPVFSTWSLWDSFHRWPFSTILRVSPFLTSTRTHSSGPSPTTNMVPPHLPFPPCPWSGGSAEALPFATHHLSTRTLPEWAPALNLLSWTDADKLQMNNYSLNSFSDIISIHINLLDISTCIYLRHTNLVFLKLTALSFFKTLLFLLYSLAEDIGLFFGQITVLAGKQCRSMWSDHKQACVAQASSVWWSSKGLRSSSSVSCSVLSDSLRPLGL